MTADISRIVRGVPTTLRFQFLNGADEPTDAGAVTLAIVDGSGTSVLASTSATSDNAGNYSYLLAARTVLGVLVVTWTVTSTGATFERVYEVVSSRYLTLAGARASHDELAADGDFSDDQVLEKRDAVELEIERITGLSFCRRRSLLVLDGPGTAVLPLPVRFVRQVVSVTTYDRLGGSGTAFTAGQLAAIARDDEMPPDSCTGLLVRTDGAVWPSGRRNVVVVVEHGYETAPPDVKGAALRLLYWRLHTRNTEVLDRATTYSAAGATFALAKASQTSTGIDEVDAVLGAYGKRGRDGSNAPASQVMRLSRNRAGSLFHR